MAQKPSKRLGAAMKPTARARIEQAVRAVKKTSGFNVVYHHDALRLILAERARLKRGVKKADRFTFDTEVGMVKSNGSGAWVFLDDILALWEG